MTPDGRQKAVALIKEQEGFRQFPYADTRGFMTIGFGRNLQAEGISQSEAEVLLNNDISTCLINLIHYLPWFSNLSDARQAVLLSMAFNLGMEGLLQFKEMLEALKVGSFEEAASQILASKAAKEDLNRYKQLAYIMTTNQL